MTEREIKQWTVKHVPLMLRDEFNYKISLINPDLEIRESYLKHNLKKIKEDAQYSEDEYKKYLANVSFG
jgi:hypothetical protein